MDSWSRIIEVIRDNFQEFFFLNSKNRNLKHPCIVQYLGIFKEDSKIYIVTEFVSNGSLDNYIKKNEKILGHTELFLM